MRGHMFAGIVTIGFLLSGCAGMDSMMQPQAQVDNNAGTQAMPPYNGPRARIAIADFDVKAAKAGGAIGGGLREMLVTALVNSQRFSVVERQVLNAVMQEQELGASGAGSGVGGAARGQIKTADLIITAAVTEFEPNASGGGVGIGGGGSAEGALLGGLLGGMMNSAHMAIDIRILDASTTEILASTRVQGKAKDFAAGFMAGVLGSSGGLGGGLSLYANTPMEKAIRVCIIEAVKYISQATPANYYKY